MTKGLSAGVKAGSWACCLAEGKLLGLQIAGSPWKLVSVPPAAGVQVGPVVHQSTVPHRCVAAQGRGTRGAALAQPLKGRAECDGESTVHPTLLLLDHFPREPSAIVGRAWTSVQGAGELELFDLPVGRPLRAPGCTLAHLGSQQGPQVPWSSAVCGLKDV